MIIPEKHKFQCWVDSTPMLIEVDQPDVMFEINSEHCVLIKDPEQVLMIRDMLTVWLSRQKQPQVQNQHCPTYDPCEDCRKAEGLD